MGSREQPKEAHEFFRMALHGCEGMKQAVAKVSGSVKEPGMSGTAARILPKRFLSVQFWRVFGK